jgi:Spy/CpxP family protein refolding chaperone
MLDQQFQALRREVSGLQSGWDRGLNAIRGDMRKELDDKFSEAQSQAGRAEFLNGIEDPEQRQHFQYILENQDRIGRTNQQSGSPNAQPQGHSDQQTEMQRQQIEQVYAYVEDRGISRSDPKVRYDLLTDPTLTPEQRKQGFYDSVDTARAGIKAAQQQQPSQGTTQRPPSDTVNPPVDGGGRSSGNSGSRQDADLNLYLTNEISRDEFLKRQPNFRR